MPKLCSLALLLVCASAGALAAQHGPPEIVVSGHAEVTVVPDRAVLSIAINSHAASAAIAGSQNAATTRRVMEALRAAGVPADSVHTAGYAVQPAYEVEEQRARQTGYVASAALRVRIGDLSRVGPVIDAALAAGADRIDGVEFTSSEAGLGRRRALAQAIREARADAEAMAAAAGGSLGALVELGSGTTLGNNVMIRGANSGVGSSVNATEIRLGVTVTGRWTLIPN